MLKAKLAAIRAARGNEGGFTLIELLVVVVILVALAAIAIPVYLNQKTAADQAAEKASVTSVANFISAGIANGQLDPGTAALTTAGANEVIDGQTNGTIIVPSGYKFKYNSGSGTFCVSGPNFKYDELSGGIASGACA